MRRSATRSSAQHGFTLIEVLAALVIVALGMIAAIQAVTQSARNGTYLRDKTLAHWIGMNVLTERRLQAGPVHRRERRMEGQVRRLARALDPDQQAVDANPANSRHVSQYHRDEGHHHQQRR